MKRFPSRQALLLYFLQGAKRYFVGSAVFACLLSLFDLLNPKIIGYTVDSIIGTQETALPRWLAAFIARLGGRAALLGHLWLVAAFVVAVALLGGGCRYLFKLCNSMGAERLVKQMRDSLYAQVEALPYAWYGEHKTGDIIQRCTSDVETIKRFLSEQLTSLVRISVMILMALYFMVGIHPLLTLFAAISIPVVILYSLFFHRSLGAAFMKVDEAEGHLSTVAQENLTGVRVVRAFGRERYERDRFVAENEVYTGMWIHMMRLLSQFWASNDFISGVQVMLVTVLGAGFCVRGQLTAGQYIAFVAYNGMLTWPVRALGRVISDMSKADISLERILYIMNGQPEADRAETISTDYKGDIVFDHVSFDYGNGKPVLEDVSFTIKGGSTVGILGGTGAGKSTLVHLLDRLYPLAPDSGVITVDGVDIADLAAKELRRHVGLVLQEPYLFSRTLAENIAIGTDNADQSAVEEAARTACLDGAVQRFTDGYNTYVGERGVTLSGGQKQRTAIAQMLIRKPDIMIFDDSLSAVDAETDAKIRAAIAAGTGESTVILISHRITTLMQADNIIVLDKGRVAEMGSHEELLAQNGIYRKIFDLQSSGSAVD